MELQLNYRTVTLNNQLETSLITKEFTEEATLSLVVLLVPIGLIHKVTRKAFQWPMHKNRCTLLCYCSRNKRLSPGSWYFISIHSAVGEGQGPEILCLSSVHVKA